MQNNVNNLQQVGLFLFRVFTGVFLMIHGWEVFDAAKMQEYAKWQQFSGSSTMPYLGKAAELIAGILLLAGLFTRLAGLIIFCTFMYICFFIGNGKFWMEDQHPFLFALIGFFFACFGAGNRSVDHYLNNLRK